MAMDMNTAFDLEVREHCPQAEVVYGQFHVAARHGRGRPGQHAKSMTTLHEKWRNTADSCSCATGKTSRMSMHCNCRNSRLPISLGTVCALKDTLKDYQQYPQRSVKAGNACDLGYTIQKTVIWQPCSTLF